MNLVDLFLILLVVSAAVGGGRMGFVARSTSWLGLALGLSLALLITPVIVSLVGSLDDAWVLFTALAVMVAFATVGQWLGLNLGERARGGVHRRVGRVDQAAGALVGGLGVLVMFWLLIPTLVSTPGLIADQTSESVIARAVLERAPEPPDTLRALRRAVGDNRGAVALGGGGTIAEPGPPPSLSGLDARVLDGAARAVVRIDTLACSRHQEGTGVVVDPGLILTNAHVVAGGDELGVVDELGRSFLATLVHFDPERDVAVLRVDGLEVPPLTMGTAGVGTIGAVFGHPGGGDLRVAPFRIDELVRARGRDLYDRVDTSREVYILATRLELGDSGAPLISDTGEVVGLAFAVSPDDPEEAFALTVGELEATLEEAATSPNPDPGPCL